MKILHPDTPLKVVRKLLRKNINIGTEGTLDCFLCDTLEEEPQSRAILLIFIGLHEDINMQLIAQVPDSMDDAEALLNEALNVLKTGYIDASVQERHRCQRLN